MKIEKPVFIIGCPRSGTTLLYTILKASAELWSAPGESHFLWQKFIPDKRDSSSAFVLSADDFKEADRQYLENQYHQWTARRSAVSGLVSKKIQLKKYKNQLAPILRLWRMFLFLSKWFLDLNYRVLDKTPPNTYRIDYIAKAFPDAKFIYLTRDAATNISSLIEAWRSTSRFQFQGRKFYSYNQYINIKGYDGDVWKFTNPPGWQAYLNKPLEEVCAFQWLSAHQYSLDSLAKIDSTRVYRVKYEDLVANSSVTVQKLCDFIEIPYEAAIKRQADNLPVVATATMPNPHKWLKNKCLIDNIAAYVEDMQLHLGYPSLLSSPLSQRISLVQVEHTHNFV